MSSHKAAKSAISRRSARTYMEENEQVELGSVTQGNNGSTSSESRYGSSDERTDTDKAKKKQDRSSGCQYAQRVGFQSPPVDLGRDMDVLFPATADDTLKSVMKTLLAAKECISENVRLGRPTNFGVVVPGAIYRSSFPMGENYEFVRGLGLRTVVTLVDKEYPSEFRPFLTSLGVRHIIIDMKGTKKLPISDDIIQAVICATLDTRNHPLLLHCNHGKHRTGCAIAAVRHVAGWNVDEIVEEYSLFAEPKIRDCDIDYIQNFDTSILRGVFLSQPSHSTVNRNSRSKMTRAIVAGVAFLVLCIITTLYFW